jgi:cytochrome c-type protein NapC
VKIKLSTKALFIFSLVVISTTLFIMRGDRHERGIASSDENIPYIKWAKELLLIEPSYFLEERPAYQNGNPGSLVVSIDDLTVDDYFSPYLNSHRIDGYICGSHGHNQDRDECVRILSNFLKEREIRVSIKKISKELKSILKGREGFRTNKLKFTFLNNSFFAVPFAKDVTIPIREINFHQRAETRATVTPLKKNRSHQQYAIIKVGFINALEYETFTNINSKDDLFKKVSKFKKSMSAWDKLTYQVLDNAQIFKHAINDIIEGSDESKLCLHCHEMSTIVQEYKESKHYSAGVSCSDCHVGKGANYLLDKTMASIHELPAHLLETYNKKSDFEQERMRMFQSVQEKIASRESASCRHCHIFNPNTLSQQVPAARKRHAQELAQSEVLNCIVCHNYGIVHKLPNKMRAKRK